MTASISEAAKVSRYRTNREATKPQNTYFYTFHFNTFLLFHYLSFRKTQTHFLILTWSNRYQPLSVVGLDYAVVRQLFLVERRCVSV